MDQVQQNFCIYNTLELLIHNHTLSYFESPLSGTLDKSIAHKFTPFMVKLTSLLIYLRTLELKKLLRKQKEIEGLLSEFTLTPLPKKCPESGNSCLCEEDICPHYKSSQVKTN